MEDIIVLKNITKNYKRKIRSKTSWLSFFQRNQYEKVEAVKNISLNIKKGDVVGYVGINGAGKSTTIKLLTGILHPDDGEAQIFGLNSFENRKKIAQNIGVMFGQRSHLLWDLPLANSFELLKRIYRVSDETYKESVDLADKYLNIKKLLHKPVRTMSLGERVKGEFVAVTLHQPKVLLLDEATLGLDVITKNEIKKMLRFLNEEKDCTILFTTHDLRDVEKICKRVVVVDKGSIIMDDQVEHILNKVKAEFISITFNEEKVPKGLDSISGVQVLEQDRNIARIKVDINTNKVDSVLNQLITEYNIESFDIVKPDLETVIVELYESIYRCGDNI